MSSRMRIYGTHPMISVCYIDELRAKVDVYYDSGRIVLKQPRYLGGKIESTLDEYDAFEGDMYEFVLHLRGKKNNEEDLEWQQGSTTSQ